MRTTLVLPPILLGAALALGQEPGRIGFETVNVTLYQADDVLQERVASEDELAAYLKSLQRVCSEFLAKAKKPELLDIVVAIKPGRLSRVWVVSSVAPSGDAGLNPLRGKLEALRAPEIRRGPVAVAISGSIAGAQPRPRDPSRAYQPPMPKEWQQAAAKAGTALNVPDGILAIVWPDEK